MSNVVSRCLVWTLIYSILFYSCASTHSVAWAGGGRSKKQKQRKEKLSQELIADENGSDIVIHKKTPADNNLICSLCRDKINGQPFFQCSSSDHGILHRECLNRGLLEKPFCTTSGCEKPLVLFFPPEDLFKKELHDEHYISEYLLSLKQKLDGLSEKLNLIQKVQVEGLLDDDESIFTLKNKVEAHKMEMSQILGWLRMQYQEEVEQEKVEQSVGTNDDFRSRCIQLFLLSEQKKNAAFRDFLFTMILFFPSALIGLVGIGCGLSERSGMKLFLGFVTSAIAWLSVYKKYKRFEDMPLFGVYNQVDDTASGDSTFRPFKIVYLNRIFDNNFLAYYQQFKIKHSLSCDNFLVSKNSSTK